MLFRLARKRGLGQVGGMFDPVTKLKEFIRHPSVSADSRFHEGMAGARDFIAGLLSSIGFAVEVVKTPRHPIVLARRGGPDHWPQKAAPPG